MVQIARNDRVFSVNAAIEVDLQGQIVAESVGTRHISGCGGQVDFVKGSSLSRDGISVIAMSACTEKGESRIASVLKRGASVTTSRAYTHYLATEYGVVNVRGATIAERVKKIISIAAPQHREQLAKDAFRDYNVLV